MEILSGKHDQAGIVSDPGREHVVTSPEGDDAVKGTCRTADMGSR